MTAARASSDRSDIEHVAQEKDSVAHNEFQQNSGMSPEDADFLANFPEERKKKAVRKVDFRLVPMLVLLYLMAYLDKTNIGNAKIEGLLDSLHMTGVDYNIALSVFFIPAGFLPGAILIISKWYLPNETQTRIAILYTSAASGGAFSGLLAFAIAKMDGVGGYEGWRWAVPNYALKFAMPQIIKNMGFTSANAQLLTIPPYAVGAISAYLFSVFADKYSWRMPFILGPQLLLVVAFTILFTKSEDIKDNIALNYFAICLACFGMYPILPGVNAWNVANTPSPTKRAISIGFLVCVGNIGGLIGSYIYMDKEAPRYPTGYGASFGFASAGIIAVITLEALLYRRNKKKELMTEDEVRQRHSDEELDRMGEKSQLFKYAL
ncbi:hypothetical protein CBS470a_007793 [Colletotrichum nupharicola]|nr:hypothetical protein CBS470a_007793 [Colletotrichum nupharicola]